MFVSVTVREGMSRRDALRLLVPVIEWDGVLVWVGVPVRTPVGVPDAVMVTTSVAVPERVQECVPEGVPVPVGDREGDGHGDQVWVTEGVKLVKVGVAVGLGLAFAVQDAVAVPVETDQVAKELVGVCDREAVMLTPGVGVSERLGGLGVLDSVGVPVGEKDPRSVLVVVAEKVAVGVAVTDGDRGEHVALWLAMEGVMVPAREADCVRDGVREGLDRVNVRRVGLG